MYDELEMLWKETLWLWSILNRCNGSHLNEMKVAMKNFSG
jgi:hypothetical protein